MKNGDIIFCKAYYNGIQKFDGLTGAKSVITPIIANNLAYKSLAIGSDILAVGSQSAYPSGKRLTFFNTSDFELSPVQPTIIQPNYACVNLTISKDNQYIAGAYEGLNNNPENVLINKLSDGSVINVTESIYYSPYGLAFNNSTTLLATVGRGGSSPYPNVMIYDTTTWAKIADLSTVFDNKTLQTCVFSPDDAFFAYGSTASVNALYLFDTATWTQITVPSTGYVDGLSFSPDGAYLTFYNISSNKTYALRMSDYVLIELPQHQDFQYFNVSYREPKALWLNNTTFIQNTFGYPEYIKYNLDLGVFLVDETYPKGDINLNTGSIIIAGVQTYEITGVIDESLIMDKWIATAYNSVSGVMVGRIEFTGTSFTIPSTSNDPVSVTVQPKLGDVWILNSTVTINQLVFPTDPISTPYYYIANNAGTSGATEPVWPTTDAGTVTDGNVVWQRVERIPMPVTMNPIVPTVVP